MTKTADDIVVGANGSLYVAKVGSARPTTVASPLGAAWAELGYTSEDGVKWTDGKTLTDIKVWQSFYAVRKIVTDKEGMIAFALMQWQGENVKLAYGGGTITEPVSGQFKYTPPDPAEIDYRAMAVEWQDGPYDFRLIFPKGLVTENVETNVVRNNAAMLPITFSLLGEEGVPPFELYTNHPAFADGIGS